MDKVNVIGVRADGSSEVIGTAPMPPRMKMKQVVAEFFEPPSDDPNDCSEANMCLWALENYHEWLVLQGWKPPAPLFTPNSNSPTT